MSIINILLLFLAGAGVGSFLGVWITRMYEEKEGIVAGRSECPKCKAKLGALELVPILSYVWQGGKCKHCGKEIDYFYPAIEITLGILFVTAGWMIGGFWHLAYVLVLVSLLTMIAFFDLKYRVLPDMLSIVVGFWGLLGFAFSWNMDLWGMVMAVLLIVAFFGGQIKLSKGEWMGEGDLVLGVALAAVVGWPGILLLLMVAYTFGAAVGLGLLVGGYIKKGAQLPFAPFLVLGALVTLFWGGEIISYYWDCQVLNMCNFV